MNPFEGYFKEHARDVQQHLSVSIKEAKVKVEEENLVVTWKNGAHSLFWRFRDQYGSLMTKVTSFSFSPSFLPLLPPILLKQTKINCI